MRTGAEMGVGLCTQCGAALSGKFCSDCGAPAEASAASTHNEGWDGVARQLMQKPSRDGIFSVALSFLRHPVDTIIRLTDDPAYRAHWGFLTACVGTQLALVYVILPRILATFFGMQDVSNTSAVFTNEIVQYVGMAIMTPIQYYVCRALGSIRRSPMSYVKLCVLSVSYGALLAIIVSLFFFTVALVDLKTVSILELTDFWQALAYLSMAAILVFVTAAHKRFWGMSWPIAAAVTAGIAAMSWLVVYPGLTSLFEGAKIGETLSSVLG